MLLNSDVPTYLLHEFYDRVLGHIDHALVTGLVNGPFSLVKVVDLGLAFHKKR